MPPDSFDNRVKNFTGIPDFFKVPPTKMKFEQGMDVNFMEQREKERANEKIKSIDGQFKLVAEVQQDLVKDGVRKIAEAKKNGLFAQTPNIDDLPDNVRKMMEKKFQTLQKKADDISTKLSDPLTPNEQDDLIGSLHAAYRDVSEAATKIMEDPVIASTSPKAIQAMRELLGQYKAMIPEGMYGRVRGEGNSRIEKQTMVGVRLLLIAVAGAYTLFALITGYKNKNYMPAVVGGVLTAALIFGPKRLLEGPGDRVVRETAFLNDKVFDDLMNKYNIKGDVWANYIESLQQKHIDFGNFQRIDEKRYGKKEDKPEEKRKEEMETLFDLQNAPSGMREILANDQDRATFLALVSGKGVHKETKETIVKYVRNGGRSKDIQVALDPQGTLNTLNKLQAVKTTP